MAMFLLLASLWLLRDPRFIPGWGELFKKGYEFSRGTFEWCSWVNKKKSVRNLPIIYNYIYVGHFNHTSCAGIQIQCRPIDNFLNCDDDIYI